VRSTSHLRFHVKGINTSSAHNMDQRHANKPKTGSCNPKKDKLVKHNRFDDRNANLNTRQTRTKRTKRTELQA